MTKLSQKAIDLLQKPAFVHLATLMPDGSPQVSAVWVDVDGDTILINSAEGRVKDKNMERDRRVGLSVTDPANPYHSLSIRGRVKDITKQGAEDHIDKLAKKYMGVDKYPGRKPGEQRVIYRIEVETLNVMG